MQTSLRLPKISLFTVFSITAIGISLSACSVVPSTITQNPGPASNRMAMSQASNGSIFSSVSYKPMFEGNRARSVGDTITINITETTTATKDAGSSGSKKGLANATATDQFGNTVSPTFSWANNLSNENKATSNASNTFNGFITATVLEVFPNGNLMVAGEKQIGYDQGSEFVRFSGVVNPNMITTNNTVASNTVADARFEYRTTNAIDSSYIASMVTRFFLSIAPF
ncbi:flagellar basal body L-ring protein FlgH [Polynucleobacter sp. CS-Odin-A6]|uniref:flagellar basal body L-ring protein FlgH n=1 Tax=Polynucleobacter sp. CS-Odin-A6 TaxID=2689106 RepID=UPI001C0C98CF|nr:flagellar basal body L-ring protein FlgH [Polynucleobacter sp. CS-Odin-A6]MBU3621872.1 flagellar basal body L-ring protein FlgH [Polynucleobacter sp. CS-Odin-A6]